MAKVVWTEKASSHLQAIYEYIAHDSPIYAERFIRSLVRACVKLETLPLCGRVVPEFDDPNIREVLFQNYRIVYSVRNSQTALPILAVLHCARDLNRQLQSEWELQ